MSGNHTHMDTYKKTNKRRIGQEKEAIARTYLERRGVRICAQNYRVRQGEIDLIGWHSVKAEHGRKIEQTLLFIEVKYRKNKKTGSALEAVTFAKQKQISKVSLFFMNQMKLSASVNIRYDVVAIDGEQIKWIQNAFDYIG